MCYKNWCTETWEIKGRNSEQKCTGYGSGSAWKIFYFNKNIICHNFTQNLPNCSKHCPLFDRQGEKGSQLLYNHTVLFLHKYRWIRIHYYCNLSCSFIIRTHKYIDTVHIKYLSDNTSTTIHIKYLSDTTFSVYAYSLFRGVVTTLISRLRLTFPKVHLLATCNKCK